MENETTYQSMSQKCDILLPALLQVQKFLKPVVRDKKNPHFKSAYASLEALLLEIVPVLSDNEIILSFVPKFEEGMAYVETELLHISGQWKRGRNAIVYGTNSPQAFGSGMTYAKRYGLCALLAIPTPGDDDANYAQKQEEKKPKKVEEVKVITPDDKKGEKISNSQVIEIQDLLSGSKKLMSKMMSHLNTAKGVMQLCDIPVETYPKVVNWIKGEKAKQ